MSDGKLIFDTEIDTSGLDKGEKNIKKFTNSLIKSLSKVSNTYEKSFDMRSLEINIDSVKNNIKNLAKEIDYISNKEIRSQSMDRFDKKIDSIVEKMKKVKNEIKNVKNTDFKYKNINSLNENIDKTENKIEKLKNDIDKLMNKEVKSKTLNSYIIQADELKSKIEMLNKLDTFKSLDKLTPKAYNEYLKLIKEIETKIGQETNINTYENKKNNYENKLLILNKKIDSEIKHLEELRNTLVENKQEAISELISKIDLYKNKLSEVIIEEIKLKNTKIKDKEVEYNKLIEKLYEYRQELKNAENIEIDKRDNSLEIKNDRLQMLLSKLDLYNYKLKSLQDAQHKTSNSTNILNKSLKNTSSSVGVSKKGINSIIKALTSLKNTFIWTIRKKLIYDVLDSFKSGMQNLAQYSNSFNNSISTFMSDFTRLKKSISTAFEPLITKVTPILDIFINKLIDVINVVAQFNARLFGSSNTFIKAKKINQDYAKSLSKTNKELKKSLASFDEINKLSNNSDNNSGEILPKDMFEEVNIDERILTFTDKLKYKLEELKNLHIEPDYSNMINSLDKLKESLDPFKEFTWEGLKFLYKDILNPIFNWSIESLLPETIDELSESLSLLSTVIEKSKPLFKWLWDKFLKPIASFNGTLFITFLDIIIGRFKFIIRQIDIAIDGLKSIKDIFAGIFTLDKNKVISGLKGVVNSIISTIENFLKFLTSPINKLIDGTNKISPFKIPSIPNIKIPRLATGTVIPASAPERLYMLGDNNRESEIISPYSTMKQAFSDSLKENGYGGNITIRFEESSIGDLVRILKPFIDKENNRCGPKIVTGGAY